MIILVVSDIHANRPVLAAIDEPHDVCLCSGEPVDYGSDPAASARQAMGHADHAINGNHDHGGSQGVPVAGERGYRYLSCCSRPSRWEALDLDERRWLLQLPLTRRVPIDGKRFLLVHGTPRDALDEYLMKDVETWSKRNQNIGADIVCVGHSHMQFSLTAGGVTMLNPGSVGQPRDGDPRNAYALIDGGKIALKRVAYPVEETAARIGATDLPDRAKRLLSEGLRPGRSPAFDPVDEALG